MKTLATVAALCVVLSGSAVAEDYAIDIANLGSQVAGAGTGLDLYSITNKSFELVTGSPFGWRKLDGAGDSYSPLLIAVSPSHKFVYAEYADGESLPYIVGFQVTPTGLIFQWATVESGAADPTVKALVAGRDYVIAYGRPFGFDAEIINKSGQVVASINTDLNVALTSVQVAPNGNVYYVCSFSGYPNQVVPPDTVGVYKLPDGALDGTAPQPITSKLLYTSTDPAFVHAECANPPVSYD